MTNQSQKSGVVSGLGAMIGAFLGLALCFHLGWDAWGLVATILPCSVAGWIAVDWRGFLAAGRQAWQTVHTRLPTFWRWWKKHVTDAGETPALQLSFVWFLVAVVWVALPLLQLEEKPPVAINGAIVLVAFLIGLIWASIVQILLTIGMGKDGVKDGVQRQQYNSRQLRRWNPLCAPFTLLGLLLPLMGKGIQKMPDAGVWVAVKLARVANWCLWTSVDLTRRTYLYANSDIRRIAFSSIALGMVVGFGIGYWLEQVLLGTVVAGAVGYGLGILQHQFIYQNLARRGLITIR